MSMIDPITGLRTPLNLIGQAPQMFGYAPRAAAPLSSLGQVASAGSSTGLPEGTSVADYISAGVGGGPAPAVANAARGSWMGNILAEQAAGGGLAGRAAGLVRGPFGPMMVGTGVTYGLNALLPSTGGAGNAREALADAAMGAGIGGTVGSIVPGVGTGIGAAAGGALGGLYGLGQDLGWFGGEEGGSADDLKKSISGNASMLGVSPTEYAARFELASKSGAKDAQGKKLSNDDIATLLGNQMIQEVVTTRQQKEASANALAMHQADLQSNLAMQDQAKAFMSPYIDNIVSAGTAQAHVLNNLADQMPGAYKGVFQAQAANALNTAQQTAGAYMGQLAIQPSMQIMDTYQKRQEEQQATMMKALSLAVQMKSQGAGGGAGAPDFSQLTAQVTPGSGGGFPSQPYGYG